MRDGRTSRRPRRASSGCVASVGARRRRAGNWRDGSRCSHRRRRSSRCGRCSKRRRRQNQCKQAFLVDELCLELLGLAVLAVAAIGAHLTPRKSRSALAHERERARRAQRSTHQQKRSLSRDAAGDAAAVALDERIGVLPARIRVSNRTAETRQATCRLRCGSVPVSTNVSPLRQSSAPRGSAAASSVLIVSVRPPCHPAAASPTCKARRVSATRAAWLLLQKSGACSYRKVELGLRAQPAKRARTVEVRCTAAN